MQTHKATLYVDCIRPRPGREAVSPGVILYQGHPNDFTPRGISAQQLPVDSVVKDQSSGEAQAVPALKALHHLYFNTKGEREG